MTITETTEAILTYTYTFTGNAIGADGLDWYGTAQPPCVSLLFLDFWRSDTALTRWAVQFVYRSSWDR